MSNGAQIQERSDEILGRAPNVWSSTIKVGPQQMHFVLFCLSRICLTTSPTFLRNLPKLLKTEHLYIVMYLFRLMFLRKTGRDTGIFFNKNKVKSEA